MAMPHNIPAGPPQSRIPKSIRFTPDEWDKIDQAARARHLEPSRFARMLCLMALKVTEAQREAEASFGVTMGVGS